MIALQELKWFISDGLDNFDESVKVSEIWEKINELLIKEKQQIINAWDDCFYLLMADLKPKTAEYYYNETYNQPKQ